MLRSTPFLQQFRVVSSVRRFSTDNPAPKDDIFRDPVIKKYFYGMLSVAATIESTAHAVFFYNVPYKSYKKTLTHILKDDQVMELMTEGKTENKLELEKIGWFVRPKKFIPYGSSSTVAYEFTIADIKDPINTAKVLITNHKVEQAWKTTVRIEKEGKSLIFEEPSP